MKLNGVWYGRADGLSVAHGSRLASLHVVHGVHGSVMLQESPHEAYSKLSK